MKAYTVDLNHTIRHDSCLDN